MFLFDTIFLHVFATIFYGFFVIYVYSLGLRSKSVFSIMGISILLFFWSLNTVISRYYASTQEIITVTYNIFSFGWNFFGPLFLMFSLAITENKKWLNNKLFYVFVFILPVTVYIQQWRGRVMGEHVYDDTFGWVYTWRPDTIWPGVFFFYTTLFSILAVYFIINYRIKNPSKKKPINIILFGSLLTLISANFTDSILPLFGIVPNLANIFGIFWMISLIYAIVRFDFLSVTPALAAKNIISAMSDYLILLDLKGRITSVNNTVLEMLGYQEIELRYKPVSILFSRKDFEYLFFEKILKGENLKDKNLKFLTRDGWKIPVIFSNKILKGSDGADRGIICLARDITEFRKFEKELKIGTSKLESKMKELELSRQKFSEAIANLSLLEKKAEKEHNKILAIISNFVDPVIMVDNMDRISLFNQAAHNVFGKKRNQAHVKIKEDIGYPMDNLKGVLKRPFTSKTICHPGPGRLEEELVVEYNGQENTYKVITVQIKDKNGIYLGTMKVFYNLTREKIIEKMKSDFISIAAHQLRTPLSAVKWSIKMVLDGDVGCSLSDEQRHILKKGYLSNERVIRLVNDMLVVARIEEGRFLYDYEKINFEKIISEAIESARNLAEGKQINITIDKPEKIGEVYFDKEKILMVLNNLLENAVKYTPERGNIIVKINKKNNNLNISVQDNGVGIPEEEKIKLFSKFFRAYNVVRMQTDGSGLGLFITKSIIERHGGRINISSKEGKGTEIDISLPIKNPTKELAVNE